MKRLLGIFGTSGMARECADIAEFLEYEIIFIAQANEVLPDELKGKTVINEDDIGEFSHASFIIGIGEGAIRQKIATKYSGRLNFCNLIHPTASFGSGQLVKIEKKNGVIICAGVRFASNIQVGDFTLFNLNATISHDCEIADYVSVSPLASVCGNVTLGKRVSVGTGANISNGKSDNKLNIGNDTVIGAGAVIVQNCDAHAVYAGVPAKRIK